MSTNEILKLAQSGMDSKVSQMQTLDDTECFTFLVKGTNLALTAGQKDSYAPKKTGVYNVDLQVMLGEADDSGTRKAQQWKYSKSEKAIISLAYPDKALFEDINKNLIVYKQKSFKN